MSYILYHFHGAINKDTSLSGMAPWAVLSNTSVATYSYLSLHLHIFNNRITKLYIFSIYTYFEGPAMILMNKECLQFPLQLKVTWGFPVLNYQKCNLELKKHSPPYFVRQMYYTYIQ